LHPRTGLPGPNAGPVHEIGLTTRTVEQRIREHQASKLRGESSEYDTKLDLMNYGEKHLNHCCSTDRIGDADWPEFLATNRLN